MEPTRTCPQCQQPLQPDAPHSLCPQCLLKAAFAPSAGAEANQFADIDNPAEVGKRLPQFEIIELIGRGGMGVVYKARQLQLDRIVALKILLPSEAHSMDFVARFHREARSLAKLNHANIVHVYDSGEAGGLYYIVMEFVDGLNLRQLFEAGKLSATEALAMVPKICEALQYAHDEGLVHRDIKPENLLFDKKGCVKIADFGLAKLLRREPFDMTLTLSGMSLGTMRYMAPEQIEKPEMVDHRADIYSLGVVIYEMLTGQVPHGRFELPSQKAQVDVRLDKIVLHALEHDVTRRYQKASEVKSDVENLAGKPAPIRVPENPGNPKPRFCRSALFGALCAGVGMVAAMLLLFFYPNPRELLAGLASGDAGAARFIVPRWHLAIGLLCMMVAVSAALGTAILGVAAIFQIRRANGKLAGQWMAVADVLVFPLAPIFFFTASGPRDQQANHIGEVPRLGTITNGIGVNFTVPAGQVATFEVVTRRDNATVALPFLAAYAGAPSERSSSGSFRWSREPEVPGVRRKSWRIEVVTSAGGASAGGLELPEALESAAGSMGLGLWLEADKEHIHWGTADPSKLPANGLIGLRVRTQAHKIKTGAFGSAGSSGAASINWEKSLLSPHSP